MGKTINAGKWEYTGEELDRMHLDAVQRGNDALEREHRAVKASHDRESNRILIELTTGATLVVPCRLIQGLSDASPDDIKRLKLVSHGRALHWDALDVQLSVEGLVAGVFGTKAWMEEIKRRTVPSDDLKSSLAAVTRRTGRPKKAS